MYIFTVKTVLAGNVIGGSAAALASGGPSPAAHRVALAGRGDGEVGARASCAAYLPPLPGRARGLQHALFVCPLYSLVHARFPDLAFDPTVHAFLEQDPVPIAAFVAECQRTHAAAVTAALGEGTAAGPAPE